MADLQSPSADWPLATPWLGAHAAAEARERRGATATLETDRFLRRFSDPRNSHCVSNPALALHTGDLAEAPAQCPQGDRIGAPVLRLW